jgi:Tetratricopeptide repeat
MSYAINGQRRALGEHDPDTLKSQAINLEFLAHTGRRQEFIRQGPAVITACEEQLGHEHPVTATAHSNFAYGLLDTATPVNARIGAERALRTRLHVNGPDHPLTCSAKLVLSRAHMLCGDHQAAVALMHEVVTGRELLLGPEHPLTVKARILYAEQLATTGRVDEERRLIDENLQSALETYGTEDPDLKRILRTLDV